MHISIMLVFWSLVRNSVVLAVYSIRQQVMHITHSADYYGIPLILYHIKPIFIY